MPFDGRSNKAKDRGYQLVYALRNLPETHNWSFNIIGGETDCGSNGCAIGLASVFWPEVMNISESEFFGITERQAKNIFYSNNPYGVPWEKVTPEMVADELEKALDNAV